MVFRDRLVFQVEVYDPASGRRDGDGIRGVKFTITDENDDVVHTQTENNAAYCVFGGGEPNCNVWVFAAYDYKWPNGKQIGDGEYLVTIVITPQRGEEATWRWRFQIKLPDQGQPPQTNLVARIAQTGPGTTSSTINQALVFQVGAYDSAVGTQDGAGIANVDLRILDSTGKIVHQRTEQTARYCAFGGGEPDCDVWVFAQHGNKWPNGQAVKSGPHTLQAIVRAPDGKSTTVQTNVNIQLSP